MSEVDPVRRLFGGALMAVGGLIAGLCGTCTVVVIGASLISLFDYPSEVGDMVGGFLVIAIVGGLPIFLGVMLFAWGRRLFPPPSKVSRDKLAAFSDESGGRP